MPPTRAQKAERASTYRAKLRSLHDAVQVLRRVDGRPDIKSYANVHNLPYRRLLRLYNGGKSRSDRDRTNDRLSPYQDLALLQFLDHIDSIGFGIRHELIRSTANAILANGHDGNSDPPR